MIYISCIDSPVGHPRSLWQLTCSYPIYCLAVCGLCHYQMWACCGTLTKVRYCGNRMIDMTYRRLSSATRLSPLGEACRILIKCVNTDFQIPISNSWSKSTMKSWWKSCPTNFIISENAFWVTVSHGSLHRLNERTYPGWHIRIVLEDLFYSMALDAQPLGEDEFACPFDLLSHRIIVGPKVMIAGCYIGIGAHQRNVFFLYETPWTGVSPKAFDSG